MAAPAEAISKADDVISRTSRLFIDNQYVEAEGGRLPVLSPVDGKPFASIAHASARDVDRAVQSARRCFDHDCWPQQDVQARVEILKRIAAALRTPEATVTVAVIESRDCGKPFSESQGDLGVCADTFDYYAEVAPETMKTTYPSVGAGATHFYARCITPWNFPLMQAVLKVAPALAAGCAVVLKPSPLASLTCCALGELVAAAGAPPGALNVITGGPPEVLEGGGSTGQYLIDHSMLDKVSFTGSGSAGQKMLEASASKLRPTCLELGGKSAFIVFEAGTTERMNSPSNVMVGIFQCTGQVCSATSRLLIHESLEAKLVERLLEGIRSIKVGDPLQKGTLMGPVVSEGQQQKVLGMIQQAEADGGKIHSVPLELPKELQQGYYVPPTVLSNLPGPERGAESSAAWKQEIFGPVLAIRSFRTEEEAIRLANDTPYGLANAVWSADRARTQRVAAQLKSGVVWENCSQVLFPSTPFGGRQVKTACKIVPKKRFGVYAATEAPSLDCYVMLRKSQGIQTQSRFLHAFSQSQPGRKIMTQQ
ncbi:Betaine aldehyde dehydrogenase 1 (OsBADH1) [Durusdinium trenchii]|uniref:Betaine aldehyde dehydrogenase 1 (OsBADH1) n=1 Tax=Durusdinium trenchii TaxID=1381693 RepID=A0ABP0R8F1_9DINO